MQYYLSRTWFLHLRLSGVQTKDQSGKSSCFCSRNGIPAVGFRKPNHSLITLFWTASKNAERNTQINFLHTLILGCSKKTRSDWEKWSYINLHVIENENLVLQNKIVSASSWESSNPPPKSLPKSAKTDKITWIEATSPSLSYIISPLDPTTNYKWGWWIKQRSWLTIIRADLPNYLTKQWWSSPRF